MQTDWSFQCIDGTCGMCPFNTLRPRQNDRHFPDDIFKWIFFSENVWISINISLMCAPRDPNNNIPTLVQAMTWRRQAIIWINIMIRLPTHICVTRPQWVKPNLFGWPTGNHVMSIIKHLLFWYTKYMIFVVWQNYSRFHMTRQIKQRIRCLTMHLYVLLSTRNHLLRIIPVVHSSIWTQSVYIQKWTNKRINALH